MTDIATSLKAFKLDGRFDVICSGSLLGINYKKIHSNSVGYKTDYEMFSMDFEEFLLALGNDTLMGIIKSALQRISQWVRACTVRLWITSGSI